MFEKTKTYSRKKKEILTKRCPQMWEEILSKEKT
jgi:hypothetical protein